MVNVFNSHSTLLIIHLHLESRSPEWLPEPSSLTVSSATYLSEADWSLGEAIHRKGSFPLSGFLGKDQNKTSRIYLLCEVILRYFVM